MKGEFYEKARSLNVNNDYGNDCAGFSDREI
jgi:hypothetical protein